MINRDDKNTKTVNNTSVSGTGLWYWMYLKGEFMWACLFHVIICIISYFYPSTVLEDLIIYVFVFFFELPLDFILDASFECSNHNCSIPYDTFIACEKKFLTQDTHLFTRIQLTDDTCRYLFDIIHYVYSFNHFQFFLLSFVICVPLYFLISFFFLHCSLLILFFIFY